MSMLPEPWLRGPLDGVDPRIAPVLYSFQQTREDLARYTEGLSAEQIWARPYGLGSLGFHIRHIAGSVERLTTYLSGRMLTEEQVEAALYEADSGATREELIENLERSLAAAEKMIRAIDPATFADPRFVGRKQLPSTVLGLLVHISEHTQRHLGQAISAANLARAWWRE